MSELNIYQRLLKARMLFHASPMKKSGWNPHGKFPYFELSDIVPVAMKAMAEVRLVHQVWMTAEAASLTLYNVDLPSESMTFAVPWGESQLKAAQGAQNVGSSVTYLRRYLYMLLMDVIENDEVDAAARTDEPEQYAQPDAQDVFSRMSECGTLKELQSVFAEAFIAAKKSGSDEYVKKLTAHYDGLKIGFVDR